MLSDCADTGDGVTQVTMLSATGCGVVVEIWLKAAGAGAGAGHNPVPVLCSGQQQALVLSRDHGLEWCTPAHLVSSYSLDTEYWAYCVSSLAGAGVAWFLESLKMTCSFSL